MEKTDWRFLAAATVYCVTRLLKQEMGWAGHQLRWIEHIPY
jgi:hypothetical protein